MHSRWIQIRENLEKKVSPHSFQMWLEGLSFLSVSDGCVLLSCPNEYLRKRILSTYQDLLLSEIKAHFGLSDFTVSVRKPNSAPATDESEESLISDSSKPPLQMVLPGSNSANAGCFLQRNFTFDHFVVGGCNNFAYTAAHSLATGHLQNQQAVFLLSATGMGKSHLSHAVGNHILSAYPTKRIYYTTAQDFTDEMFRSFQTDTFAEFSDKYRKNCDVLLLEDVHAISGKERTQIELTRTLDSLFNANKKIIFSSSYLPMEIPKIHSELRSRLGWGVVSTIEPPEFRTRVQILKQKCKLYGYQVPETVLQYLAGELVENIRQLESGLVNVVTRSHLLNHPITLQLAEKIVKTIVSSQGRITVGTIQKLICQHYRIAKEDLVSNSRKKSVLLPRQIAMYLCRKYTDQSLTAIGKSFNRYHATTIHAIANIEKGLREDAQIQNQIQYLSDKINAL